MEETEDDLSFGDTLALLLFGEEGDPLVLLLPSGEEEEQVLPRPVSCGSSYCCCKYRKTRPGAARGFFRLDWGSKCEVSSFRTDPLTSAVSINPFKCMSSYSEFLDVHDVVSSSALRHLSTCMCFIRRGK